MKKTDNTHNDLVLCAMTYSHQRGRSSLSLYGVALMHFWKLAYKQPRLAMLTHSPICRVLLTRGNAVVRLSLWNSCIKHKVLACKLLLFSTEMKVRRVAAPICFSVISLFNPTTKPGFMCLRGPLSSIICQLASWIKGRARPSDVFDQEGRSGVCAESADPFNTCNALWNAAKHTTFKLARQSY